MLRAAACLAEYTRQTIFQQLVFFYLPLELFWDTRCSQPAPCSIGAEQQFCYLLLCYTFAVNSVLDRALGGSYKLSLVVAPVYSPW